MECACSELPSNQRHHCLVISSPTVHPKSCLVVNLNYILWSPSSLYNGLSRVLCEEEHRNYCRSIFICDETVSWGKVHQGNYLCLVFELVKYLCIEVKTFLKWMQADLIIAMVNENPVAAMFFVFQIKITGSQLPKPLKVIGFGDDTWGNMLENWIKKIIQGYQKLFGKPKYIEYVLKMRHKPR